MSDGISSPPDGVAASRSGTDTVTGSARVGAEAGGNAAPETGRDTGSRGRSDDTHSARDPAVSIAASIVDLKPGDRLVETVARIDAEGRPVLETKIANYALTPDAGLKAGDSVHLLIHDAAERLHADLITKNGTALTPPPRLSLTVTALHIDPTHTAHSETASNTIQAYKPGGQAIGHMGGQIGVPGDTVAVPAAGEAFLPPPIVAVQPTALPPIGAPPAQPPGTMATPGALLLNAEAASTPSMLAAAGLSDATGSGAVLRPAIALTAAGQTLAVNPISPAIAQLIPSRSLLIQSVTSLTLDETRALSLPIQAVQHSDAALTRLETHRPDGARGPVLFAPLPAISGLVGRPVFTEAVDLPDANSHRPPVFAVPQQVSPSGITSNDTLQQNQSQKPAAQFDAVFTPHSPDRDSNADSGAGLSQTGAVTPSVPISLLPKDSPVAPVGSLVIQTATILGTQLEASGPHTRVDLGTSIGTFRVNLPVAARPAPGDILTVMPPPDTQTRSAHSPAGVAGDLGGADETGSIGGAITGPSGASGAALPGQGTAASASQLAAQISAMSGTEAGDVAAAATLTARAASAGLEAELAALIGAGDPVLTEALAARSADGGGRLTQSMLFLFAALGRGRGDAGQRWAPDLGGGPSGLLDTLRSQFTRFFAPTDAPPRDWNFIQLPFDIRDSSVSLLTFWWRYEDLDADQKRQNPGSTAEDSSNSVRRFLLDVSFTVIGPIQLDGHIADKRFDLTLRTEKLLPTGLAEDLSGLFAAALDANGYTGALRIREGERFVSNTDKPLAGDSA